MMKLIEKRFYKPVNDYLKMPEELINLENELIKAGYKVKPRGGPVVKVELDDGEVHYCPGEGGIWEYIFKDFYFREERFTITEAKLISPQCETCENKTGVFLCKIYGDVPRKVKVAKEDCPEYLPKNGNGQ